MYCIRCGAKNTDDSVFCSSCGSRLSTATQPAGSFYVPPSLTTPEPVSTPVYTAHPSAPVSTPVYTAHPSADPATAPKSDADPLRMGLGVLLILGGLIPYLFFQSNANALANFLTTELSRFSVSYIASLSPVVSVLSIIEILFCFPACVFSIITGIALLQNRWKLRRATILCGLFHLIFTVYTVAAPSLAQSLFLFFASRNGMGGLSVLEKLPLSSLVFDDSTVQVLFSLALAVLCFGFPAFRRTAAPSPLDESGRSVASLYIMVPFLALFRIAVSLGAVLGSLFVGSNAGQALANANAILDNRLGDLPLWLFIGCVVLFLLLRNVRFPMAALFTVGGLALACVLFFNGQPDGISGIPYEILSATMACYRSLFWSSAAMLIAVALWIVAATRSRVPIWLQWILSIVLPFLCVIFDILGFTSMGLTQCIGQYVCAGVTAFTALICGCRNPQPNPLAK